MNRLLQGNIILFLNLVLPGLAFCDAKVLKIGAIASLQGGAAEQGRNWLDGATLAAEELNRDGIPVKLIVEDDSTQSAKSVSAFNKLATIDKVDAMVAGTWDFLGEAVYPLASRYKIFTVNPANPKEIFSDTAKKNAYVLTNGLSLEAEEKALTSFILASGKKTIGIVSVQFPFATAHAELLKNLSQKLELTVVGEVALSTDDQPSSFKVAAQKVSKNDPEIVYVVADYGTLDIFMTELENLKKSPIVLTTQHLEGAFALSKQNQSRYRNCYAVHPKYNSSTFDDRFTVRFGHTPRVFSAEGYDAVKYLAHSFKASPDGPKNLNFTYQGLMGEYKYPKEGNALINDQATIVHFKDGKLINTPAPL